MVPKPEWQSDPEIKLTTPCQGARGTRLNVTLAAYPSLPGARVDWDAFERAASSATCKVVDAVLIERTLDEVSAFHSQSAAGWGRGVIASAVYGLLWPPSIFLGALAGSMAGHTMTEVRRSLSREAISGLGAVLDHGPFLIVIVADRRCAQTAFVGALATQIASLPLDSTAHALRSALNQDDFED